MSETQVDQKEVQHWVELLRSQASEDRLKAAAQLGRLGIRTRGAVRTRGSLSSPAQARTGTENLKVALQALSDAHPSVRREVAFAAGEWANEAAVSVLQELTLEDEDAQVRIAAAEALAKIGGPLAVAALQVVAQKDAHEDVRAAAIIGLGSLALASGPQTKAPAVRRTRGAVRTRGAAAPLRNPEVQKILKLLQDVCQEDPSGYVRDLADHTLAGLDN
jgi:HEAT repeat protein